MSVVDLLRLYACNLWYVCGAAVVYTIEWCGNARKGERVIGSFVIVIVVIGEAIKC